MWRMVETHKKKNRKTTGEGGTDRRVLVGGQG